MKLNEILKEDASNFLTDINEIEAWLKEMEIKNYTINNGVVDVAGDVNIVYKDLTQIPIQFGRVTGDFSCHSNELTSLAGCPTYVGGSFWCDYNQLVSLEGGPRAVGNGCFCDNNKLTSLSGAPETVGTIFNCEDNELTSLEGCPSKVNGDFYCSNNNITSHVLGLILTGCTGLEAEGGWAIIVNKYLGRPDDIFECQAELIEQGFDEHALL